MINNTTRLLSLLAFFLVINVFSQDINVRKQHQLEVKKEVPFKIIQQEGVQNTSEIITFSAPPPASNPIPENGATDVPVVEVETATGMASAVILSWQGSDEADNYEINLGVTPTNLNYLGDFQGTLLTLTGVAEETTYYWQIIPKNASGSATNNPVWSFTTANMDVDAAPLAAIDPTPENGAVNVTLTPTENAAGDPTQELNFSWNMPSDSEIAAEYTFKLGFDDDVDLFETTTFLSNITITGIPYGEEIFWEVIPVNSEGSATGTSVWSFTTEDLANEGAPLAAINPTPENEAVDVILIEEIDEDDNVVLSLDFSWELPEDSEPVAEYELKIGLDNQVNDFSTTLTGTSINLTGIQKGITYFWQVIPSNSSGEAVNNEVWSFTTEEVPTDAVPLAAINPTPEDGAENVTIDVGETPDGDISQNVVFAWEFPEESEFVAFVDFELSESPDFSEAFEITLIGNASELNLSGMDYETTYYWRVTPTNSTGDAEEVSVWSFTTEESLSNESFEKSNFVHFMNHNYLHIQAHENINDISIYTINGQLLYQLGNSNSTAIKIDLNAYPNGVYLSKMNINGATKSFKFVK